MTINLNARHFFIYRILTSPTYVCTQRPAYTPYKKNSMQVANYEGNGPLLIWTKSRQALITPTQLAAICPHEMNDSLSSRSPKTWTRQSLMCCWVRSHLPQMMYCNTLHLDPSRETSAHYLVFQVVFSNIKASNNTNSHLLKWFNRFFKLHLASKMLMFFR